MLGERGSHVELTDEADSWEMFAVREGRVRARAQPAEAWASKRVRPRRRRGRYARVVRRVRAGVVAWKGVVVREVWSLWREGACELAALDVVPVFWI